MNKKIKVLLISSLLTFNSLAMTAFAQPNVVKSDKIDKGYIELTKEEKKNADDKLQEAFLYAESKAKSRSSYNYKVNRVGQFIQTTNYTCGPSALRSAIYAYTTNVPGEWTLAGEIGTTEAAGTPFSSLLSTAMNKYAPGNRYVTYNASSSSNWQYTLNFAVGMTIDANYNVVANINTGVTDYPIHWAYANGIAHYVTIYGYDQSASVYYVSDPNYDTRIPYVYQSSQTNMTESTRARGIVW